jgi:hypothetical protein
MPPHHQAGDPLSETARDELQARRSNVMWDLKRLSTAGPSNSLRGLTID